LTSTQIETKAKTSSPQMPAFTPVNSNLLQRKCACGGTPGLDGECEVCRKQRLQRSTSGGAERGGVPTIVHEVLRSPGKPLDPDARAFMEPRFGHDFGQVRVHTDTKAAESAQAVNATAYTVGQELVFGTGQYAPRTMSGQRLLAHELAHVVQQARGGTSAPPPLPGSMLEQAADRVASALTHGSGPIEIAGASAPGLARQPRSFVPSLDPGTLSDEQLEQEIDLIRRWLLDNPVSSPENDQLMVTLQALESEARRRQRPNEPTDSRPRGLPSQASESIAPGLSATSVLAPRPRSLNESQALNLLSDEELEQEINSIREWLLDNPSAGQERDDLVVQLQSLWTEVSYRQRVTPAPSQVTAQSESGAPTTSSSISPDQLISSHTSWGNLDEAALGRALLQQALGGNYDRVHSVLNALSSTDRDDVSFEFCQAASDENLLAIGGTDSGRELLSRLYDELTAGSVSEEETAQANRVLRGRFQQALPPAQFEAGMLRRDKKIFPFRLPGWTVFNAAPLSAERRPGGKIWVKQPVHVLGTRDFRNETSTLPTEVFTSGIELPEEEVVGVRMYDLGGELRDMPALSLLELSHAATTRVLSKIGEGVLFGATLGVGSAATAGISWAARALVWLDRAAAVIGVLATVIDEHRGWILQRFGETGREFLLWTDRVNTVVNIYGGVRALVGLVQLTNGLRTAFQRWKARRQDIQLTAEEVGIANTIDDSTEQFLKSVDEARAAQSPALPEPPTQGAAIAPEPTPAPVPTEVAPAPVPSTPAAQSAAAVPESGVVPQQPIQVPRLARSEAGTPPRVETPGRPGNVPRGTGRRRSAFADDPEFAEGLKEIQEEAQQIGMPETLEDLQAADPRIQVRSTPGGAPQPASTVRGNFAHKYAEDLIPELPRGLDDEVIVPSGEGEIRIDRVDWKNGTIYEVRPANQREVAAMNKELPGRLRAMDREYPLGSGRRWQGRVVTYTKEKALQVLQEKYNYTREAAVEILRVYGFEL
jgi:hypothetical protein